MPAILHQCSPACRTRPLKARDLKGLRLGIRGGYFFAVLDPEIGRDSTRRATG
jgi:hypothetical protein